MPITRYTASADTTITNAYKPYSTSRAYYANMGAADSLEMFSIYHSGTAPESSRILLKFPIDVISSSLSTAEIPATSKFFLNLYNVEHPETLPKKFFAVVKSISSSWDEGYGLDLDNYQDIGQSGSIGYGSNWKFRSTTDTNLSWSQAGGDFISSPAHNFYFENGTEDLSVDVTDLIFMQVSGTIPANGFAVFLSGAYEDGTNQQNYYTKRFSARSTEYFYSRPIIEARWESIIKDDRDDFYFINNNLSDEDNTQNIYFYNRFNNKLKDLNNDPTVQVKIINSSGSQVASTVTAIKTSTGTYKAAVLATGSYNDTLYDIWYSGSTSFYTGSIDAKIRTFDDTLVVPEYVFSLNNLKSSYKTYEKPSIRIFSRYKNWSPNRYVVATPNIETNILKELYYKIFRIVDNKTIIDYGISPIAYTKCSYDKNGNYFDLDMSIFEPGFMYGIKLSLKNENNMVESPIIFKFKVE